MQRSIFRLLFFSCFLLLLGCSQFKKASDLISKPTAREKYQREFNISDELFALWERQAELSFRDSLEIEPPYIETGFFHPRSFRVYSYNLKLNSGELLKVKVRDTTRAYPVFIDLFRQENDSSSIFKKVKGSEFEEKDLIVEIKETGSYKLRVQPSIQANSPFTFEIETSPVYNFPVAGMDNTSIQSLWGAQRDGGRRSHEGVDIFAERGTPVVAATEGRVSSTGEKGLGGKQVWMRDFKRGQSLYYAHLDSIAARAGNSVNPGDTLGFVGNTGNARTTPPHLHFGIYRGYGGAIDPLYYIFQNKEELPEIQEAPPKTLSLLITGKTANLRNRPSTTGSEIISTAATGDTLHLLGSTKDWYHVRTFKDKAAFIHKSLAAPL